MPSNKRRQAIIEYLLGTDHAVSATTLANEFDVSRQVIVGDIALLRAAGHDILATPRGYLINSKRNNPNPKIVKTIACKHKEYAITADEIYTIVEFGGNLLDVVVEHPLYGQISGQLSIYSKFDADEFLKKYMMSNVIPLSELTDGIHLHTVECDNLEQFQRIKHALHKKGILLDND